MAIEQSVVIALNIMYGNQASSASDLEWWASPAAADITYDQAVVLFATSAAAQSNYQYLASPNVASPEQYVIQIFANSYGIAAADIDPLELAYWVNWLSLPDTNGIPNYLELPSVINQFSPPERQAALVNRADVALDFTQKMLAEGISSFTPTQSGSSWSIINTVTADPATVTAAKESSTTFAQNSGSSNGQTFALTPATDVFNGTSANDLFIAGKGFVQASDQLNGGGGQDTFRYFLADLVLPATAVPQLTDVETVELVGGLDDPKLIFSTAKGLQSVTYVTPEFKTKTIEATLPDNVALGLQSSATVTDVTGNWATSTIATFTITNVPGPINVNLNGAKLATLAVDAKGGTTITDLKTDSALVKTVNISADKFVTIDNLVTNVAAAATLNFSGAASAKVANKLADNFTTIDASKLNGGLNIKAGDGNITFTGGKGADTIDFSKGKFTDKDILDGGAGADKLVLKDSNLDATLTKAVNAVTNFETLGLVLDGTDSAINATKITAFKSYEFSGAPSKIDIAGATPDNTFALVGLNNAGKDFTVVANDQKAATSTKLVLQDASTLDNLTFTAFSNSTLNVASQIATGKSADANTLNVKTGGTPSGVKFVVTGDQDLTLNAANATATQIGVNIDASAFSGKLTAIGATGAANIAGNTIIGGKAADDLTGGNGTDFITGNDGADILTGGGAGVQGDVDTFNYLNVANSNAGSLVAGKESYDTITDFQNSNIAKDILNLKAAGWSASQLQPQAIIDPTVTTLDAAVLSASDQIGSSNLGFFLFGANTYVLGNDTDITKVGASDLLVKLNNPLNLTASNFTA
jgi:hypothetical protein